VIGRFYYNGHNLEKKEISYHDTCSGVEVIHRLSYKYLVERELLITNMQTVIHQIREIPHANQNLKYKAK